jgi:hypothetical protein
MSIPATPVFALALKQDFLAVPVDRPSMPVSGLPTLRPLADDQAEHH